MASDEDYASFLDKANQDTGASKVSAQSSKSVGTKAVNTQVLKALEEVEEYYVSEADEAFEPVSLQWEGKELPSEDEFAKLIGHDAAVSSVSEKEFDPRSQYEQVLSTVKRAGSGSVKILRVELGNTRCEYYVVSLDKKEGRIVGLKALAVES